MKKRLIPIVCILICAVLTAVSCLLLRRPNEALIRPEGMTVETRFAVPGGL